MTSAGTSKRASESAKAPPERVSSSSDERFSARLKAALAAGMPLVVMAIFAIVEFPLCPFKLGTGVPCPGCGLTRATLAGLSLDLHGLLHFHPLAPILTPLVLWHLGKPVLLALGWIEKERIARLPKIPQPFYWALGVTLAVLWIGRLAGFFGGHPDPIDLTQGFVYRAAHAVWVVAGGA